MDRVTLSRIDEELDSCEVAALRFLCRDIVTKKRLEGVRDAKDLFLKLEEKGLMENESFLTQLLGTICRPDLLRLLETDSRRLEETDAAPILSAYTVMLYEIYQDLTQENFEKMKFLLDGDQNNKLDKRKLELCKTALDLFTEMEKAGFLSNRKLDVLHKILQQCDRQLATMVERHMQGLTEHVVPPHVSMDHQRINNNPSLVQPSLSVTESQPSYGGESVYSDSDPITEPHSLHSPADYYDLNNNPRGLCVIFNNEKFEMGLSSRRGSKIDEEALYQLFDQFGFTVEVYHNLTANDMRQKVQQLGKRNFSMDDALVVCVLSHGLKGTVFGSDEQEVFIRDLMLPFTSLRAPSLAGKPKIFFIQACQGNSYQAGAVPHHPRPRQESQHTQNHLEEDVGRVPEETIPAEADFLLGMATVPECKSFRHTTTGSIFIQELCRQLRKAAESPEMDDLLSVLTRVNSEVSKGVYLRYKQMPEPKFTLTRKIVLKYI